MKKEINNDPQQANILAETLKEINEQSGEALRSMRYQDRNYTQAEAKERRKKKKARKRAKLSRRMNRRK